MIITEFVRTRADSVALYKVYSDKKVYIKNQLTDAIDTLVIDIENNLKNYVETTLKIPVKSIVEETIEEPEIENGDQELTDEEAMELLKEVF